MCPSGSDKGRRREREGSSLRWRQRRNEEVDVYGIGIEIGDGRVGWFEKNEIF